MDFMKSGMLIKVLRVLGWLIIIAGVIVGIWAQNELGQWVGDGERFLAFITPVAVGFLSSIGSFWMAAVLENQEGIMKAIKNDYVPSPKVSDNAENTDSDDLEVADSPIFRCNICGREIDDGNLCGRCAKNKEYNITS